MGRPDATAAAALSGAVLHPCFVAFLDITGDPVRVTTAPYDVTFSSTGDADLDGNTFLAADPQMISISDVQHKEDGSETVTATLSGLIGIDTALLNAIGDPTKWRGRSAGLWLMLYDSALARVGNIWRFYTGTMVGCEISGAVDGQSIELHIEGYLASLSQASNRTYLDQASFDSGDLSANASVAIANGNHGAKNLSIGLGLGGGGGRFDYREGIRIQ